jgi:hypothetical protein
MRKVVAAEYVTVDGVMADPGGVGEIEHGGWSNESLQRRARKAAKRPAVRERRAAARRVTFEGFAAAWPLMEETEGEFAVRMNALPKYVASRSLEDPLAWNGTLLKGISSRKSPG